MSDLVDDGSIQRPLPKVQSTRSLHGQEPLRAGVIPIDKPFDAAVGRYFLMFLPDPVSVLRSLSRLVRPGGLLAFQEPSWGSSINTQTIRSLRQVSGTSDPCPRRGSVLIGT